MERMINIYKIIAKQRQLVVFIDNLHKMSSGRSGKQNPREKYTEISEGIKRLTNVYDIPIISTVEVRKTTDPLAWPTEDDIKETIDLVYDADAVFMLHNEYTVIQDNTISTLSIHGNGALIENNNIDTLNVYEGTAKISDQTVPFIYCKGGSLEISGCTIKFIDGYGENFKIFNPISLTGSPLWPTDISATG